jgi:DNA helicase HerA-like ATPase
VRLIRSKGVGVYFVTQNPLDIPDTVLAQLGNRVQHALRAFTPRDQKAVKAAAETFRQNPKLSRPTRRSPSSRVGEALVSMLEGKGTPDHGRAHPDRAADGAGRPLHLAGGAPSRRWRVCRLRKGQIRHDDRS